MGFASAYLSIEKSEGVEGVKLCIENAHTKEVVVNGAVWHVMGDMSAVSVDGDRVEVLDHIHELDGYKTQKH